MFDTMTSKYLMHSGNQMDGPKGKKGREHMPLIMVHKEKKVISKG